MAENQRGTLLASRTLFGLMLASAMFWWTFMWYRGALSRVSSAGAGAYLLAFGLIQLFGCLLMFLLLWGAQRSSSRSKDKTLVALGSAFLIASLLYYLTPAIGAPGMALISLASLPVVWSLFRRGAY